MNVKEYWFFIDRIRDDWELEGLQYNGFEIYLFHLSPADKTWLPWENTLAIILNPLRSSVLHHCPLNEALSGRVRSVVFILELKRTDHSI